MGYSIDILNNIRLNSSAEYQERIPEATQTNLTMIGQALQTYTMLHGRSAEVYSDVTAEDNILQHAPSSFFSYNNTI